MPKSIKLTYEKTVKLLDLAVKERGEDYVYRPEKPGEACAYFHGKEPGCIIGFILAKEGLKPKDLDDPLGTGEVTYYNKSSVGTLLNVGIIKADPRTQALLIEVQCRQDQGSPWGMAVASAKRMTR